MAKGKPLFFDMGRKDKATLEAEDYWDILFHNRAKKREAGGYYTTCPASLQPPPPPACTCTPMVRIPTTNGICGWCDGLIPVIEEEEVEEQPAPSVTASDFWFQTTVPARRDFWLDDLAEDY